MGRRSHRGEPAVSAGCGRRQRGLDCDRARRAGAHTARRRPPAGRRIGRSRSNPASHRFCGAAVQGTRHDQRAPTAAARAGRIVHGCNEPYQLTIMTKTFAFTVLAVATAHIAMAQSVAIVPQPAPRPYVAAPFVTPQPAPVPFRGVFVALPPPLPDAPQAAPPAPPVPPTPTGPFDFHYDFDSRF